MKAVNSAKRKRVEEAMDLGQGDDRLPGTDRTLPDIAMVPPIPMAGIKSASYKTKISDRTLTVVMLELELLSLCGESTLTDFKPFPMNHGKGSVVGQLVPVEYNRTTVSETVSIDEPAGGYMEMLDYRNSARGHLISLEDKSAMEGYLEKMTQDSTMKQKAHMTLFCLKCTKKNDRAVVEPSMESKSVTIPRRRNENHAENTRSDRSTLYENRITTEVRLVHDWTNLRGRRFVRQKNIEGRKGVPNDECERSDNTSRSSSSVREGERRSLFHSIYDRTNFSVSHEHLCRDAKSRR